MPKTDWLTTPVQRNVVHDAGELDSILALQFMVAWAGEKSADPERLKWWDTDILDERGGGDFMARLFPKTAQWAGPKLVRRAATVVDARARARSRAKGIWTLFFLGFELDEELDERIAYHRNAMHVPRDVFGAQWLPDRWSLPAFESWLRDLCSPPEVQIDTVGRRLNTMTTGPLQVATALVAALLPIAPLYPMPYMHRPPVVA
jgi:hypothetical protein